MPDIPHIPQPLKETANRVERTPARLYTREHLAATLANVALDNNEGPTLGIWVNYLNPPRGLHLTKGTDLLRIPDVANVRSVSSRHLYPDESALDLHFNMHGVRADIFQNEPNSESERRFNYLKYTLESATPKPQKGKTDLFAIALTYGLIFVLAAIHGALLGLEIDSPWIFAACFIFTLPTLLLLQYWLYGKMVNRHRQWLFYELPSRQGRNIATIIAAFSLGATITVPFLIYFLQR